MISNRLCRLDFLLCSFLFFFCSHQILRMFPWASELANKELLVNIYISLFKSRKVSILGTLVRKPSALFLFTSRRTQNYPQNISLRIRLTLGRIIFYTPPVRYSPVYKNKRENNRTK